MKHSITHSVFKNRGFNDYMLNYVVGKTEVSLLSFIAGNNRKHNLGIKADALKQYGYWSLYCSTCGYLPKNQRVILVRSLATKPEFRGNEYASFLLYELIYAAKKLGAIIVLDCAEYRYDRLYRYYRKHGFKAFLYGKGRLMFYDYNDRFF